MYEIGFSYVCSVCACLGLSVSSSSWGLGRAAVCDCGTLWIFLLPFFWSLKYGVWYSIYSVVVKYNKVTVMVAQNRYSKLRIPSQLHTPR